MESYVQNELDTWIIEGISAVVKASENTLSLEARGINCNCGAYIT